MSVLGQISTGTGHLIPNPERAYSEQPVVNRSEQVPAETEQIQHEAVDREKSLYVRSGFEPTHLTLALSRWLVGDFRLNLTMPYRGLILLAKWKSRI